MTTSTRLEAQVVYFALKSTLRSGILAENWAYVYLPITIEHLKMAPTIPDNFIENFDETKRQFLGYLSGLYDQGGDMEGWKAHSIEGPVGNQSMDGVRARVIQVRELHEYSKKSN